MLAKQSYLGINITINTPKKTSECCLKPCEPDRDETTKSDYQSEIRYSLPYNGLCNAQASMMSMSFGSRLQTLLIKTIKKTLITKQLSHCNTLHHCRESQNMGIIFTVAVVAFFVHCNTTVWWQNNRVATGPKN